MSRTTSLIRIMLSTAAVLGLVSSSTHAATVSYGDFVGDNLTFQMVTESSSNPLFPLYGPPIVTGDSLVFSPLSFEANANGTADPDTSITDGQLNIMLQPDPGYTITGISIGEFGDYSLAGDDVTVSAGTSASAQIGGMMPILGSAAFSDSTADDPPATPWELEFSLDVVSDGKVNFVMNNSLLAEVGAFDEALIKKKNLTINVHTMVPEPTGAALALLAGLSLICRMRRLG